MGILAMPWARYAVEYCTLHTYLGPTVGGAVKAMSYKNRIRQLGEERYPPLLFPCGKYVRIIAVPSLPSAHLDWTV